MADKTSILVQLGLSKSQIKQLPRSIRDEADMIDGTRDIVAKMPAGAPKSIMTSSIAEAIDIFKSTLLEQTEVELTELQKKQIQEHKPEEGREITETPTGDEQPETGEQPGEEKPGGEEEPAGEEGKEGGEEGGKEGGDEGGEEGGEEGGQEGGDDGGDGGEKGDEEEPKDLGGEDLPRTSGGGGGKSAPLDIPEDAYPIPRIGEEAFRLLDRWSFVDFNHGYPGKAPKWIPSGNLNPVQSHPDLFFMWSVEQWVIAWNVMSLTEWSPQPATLTNKNLFSLMQYKWERLKGKQTKALDRYYIYSQYTNFMLFFLNSGKGRTIGFEALTFNLPEGEKLMPQFAPDMENNDLPRKLTVDSLVRPFENYLPYMQKEGYYPGEKPSDIDKTLTKFLPRAEAILDPYYPAVFSEDDEQKIDRIFALSKYTRSNMGKGLYYTNGFKEGVGVTAAELQDEMKFRYVEMVKFDNLTLVENKGRLTGGNSDVYRFKIDPDDGKIYALHSYSSTEGLMKDLYGMQSENTMYTRELENPYDAYLLVRKIWESSMFFRGADQNFAPPYMVNMIVHNMDVGEIASAMSVYLKFNRNISGLKRKLMVTNDSEHTRTYFHDETSDGSFNPDPSSASWDGDWYSQAYSIAWTKSAYTGVNSINITLPGLSEVAKSSEPIRIKPKVEPKPEPPKRKARTKKVKSEEYLRVEAEIKSLKSAMKYVPADEREEIKQEIEALTQSLKYI